MLFLSIITISYIQASVCVKVTPGQPVPHAEVLDELLSKYLGDSYSNNALFNFILGAPNDNRDANLTNDNLDIKILDVDNVRKIIDFAKKKHGEAMAAEHARRQNNFRRDQAYYSHPYVNEKALDLMKQTIYMTKERVNATFPFRKKYHMHPSYQIALLYGAASAILGKMESLLAQMKHFWWRTHFLWFLIVYEKILACNIDISDSIEKLFMVQKQFARIRGPKLKEEKFNIDKLKSRPGIPKDAIEHMEQQQQQAMGK